MNDFKTINFLKEKYNDDLLVNGLHNNINFEEEVDVVGFDFDHTFFSYNIHNLLEHIYLAFTKVLVLHKGYPKVLIFEEEKEHEFINKENVHRFAGTEIVIDIKKGNLIKLDENRMPIVVYHGVRKLNDEEVKEIYQGLNVEISFDNPRNKEYHINFTNFENHLIPIFAFCVYLFDNKQLPHLQSYHNILEDFQEAITFNYMLKDPVTNKYYKMEEVGYYFPEICKNTEKYFTKNIKYIQILERLIKKGKKVFLVTNSTFEYTHALMRCIFQDSEYKKYFDLLVFYSKKPAFFNKNLKQKGYLLEFRDNHSHNGKEINLEDYELFHNDLFKEKLMNEGNFHIVEKFYRKLLLKQEVKFCYVGDHIVNDCLYIVKEIENWKVVFVSNYLKPNHVEVHENYSEKWGDYFIHQNGTELVNTYAWKTIKDYKFFIIPNIECILLLFENI